MLNDTITRISNTIKNDIVMKTCKEQEVYEGQHLTRMLLDFSTAHINDANISTSSLPLMSGMSLKCFSTMLAKTLWTSSTSANIGVRLLVSSSSKRELLRLLCSLDSRRGRLAGVTWAGGLRPLEE